MFLKEGMVLIYGDGSFEYESMDDFCHFAANEKLVHYVCLSIRVGVEEFVTRLEFTHYHPNNAERNDLLSLRSLIWSELPWVVISVPLEENHLVQEIAEMSTMRIASGRPVVISGDKTDSFPINGKNVFTIENMPGHPIYRNDSAINSALRTAENELVDRIREGKDKIN
jgi:hypothetical protein